MKNYEKFIAMNSTKLARTLAKYMQGSCDICPALKICTKAAKNGTFTNDCKSYLREWFESEV